MESLSMSQWLRILEAQLTAVVERAGFLPTDRMSPDHDEQSDVEQLEYVSLTPDRRRVLLDVCHIVDQHTLSVAQWAPDDLKHVDCWASIEAIARHTRTWRLDGANDPYELVREIVQCVKGWFASVPVIDKEPCAGSAAER
jgi:hypothetical protein